MTKLESKYRMTVGNKIGKEGAILLDLKPCPGYPSWQIVLCLRTVKHEFVVWSVNDDCEFQSGEYFLSLRDAINAFEKRK